MTSVFQRERELNRLEEVSRVYLILTDVCNMLKRAGKHTSGCASTSCFQLELGDGEQQSPKTLTQAGEIFFFFFSFYNCKNSSVDICARFMSRSDKQV